MSEEKDAIERGYGMAEGRPDGTRGEKAQLPPGGWQAVTHDPTNRRKFLKTLLVGSAVATAGGAATVVAIERVRADPFPSFGFLGATNSPGSSKASACTTGTNKNDYAEQSTFNNSESIFLWGLFTNLPGGKYTISIDPTIKAKNGAVCSPTPGPNPLEYNGGDDSKSDARLYDMTASAVSWDCSPAKQSDLPDPTRKGGSLESIFATPISVAAGDDLQLQIHMHNACSGARTIVVTISLFQVVNGTTQTPAFLQAHTTITINA